MLIFVANKTKQKQRYPKAVHHSNKDFPDGYQSWAWSTGVKLDQWLHRTEPLTK